MLTQSLELSTEVIATTLSLTSLPEVNLNPNQFNLTSMMSLGNKNLTTVLNTKNENPLALTF